jgi:hypothetical protein
MRHYVSVGDEILILGHLFIITEVRVEMNKPTVLITKQPVELMAKADYKECK